MPRVGLYICVWCIYNACGVCTCTCSSGDCGHLSADIKKEVLQSHTHHCSIHSPSSRQPQLSLSHSKPHPPPHPPTLSNPTTTPLGRDAGEGDREQAGGEEQTVLQWLTWGALLRKVYTKPQTNFTSSSRNVSYIYNMWQSILSGMKILHTHFAVPNATFLTLEIRTSH